MKSQDIEETASQKPCPFCGKKVVVKAYVEGGGMGYWCPLCKRSIPYVEKADMPITEFLNIWICSILFVILSGTIGFFIVEILRIVWERRPLQ
jgi:predicted RNA-binding Zn-ribbon protein involved in translation (DUF1610 family)